MELLLVRHGRPHAIENNDDGADPGLTDDGQSQSRRLALALAADIYGPVTAVVSSTMRRAVETAGPTAEALGLEVTLDKRLVELDDGSKRYGNGFTQFTNRADAWAAINRGEWDGHRFDPQAFVARVVEGMDAVVHDNPEGRVVVFCHGGVISAYLGHVTLTEKPLFFDPDHASVSRVLADPSDYRELLSANECGHLLNSNLPITVSC
jgi:broad specificity phosphatase PhoE